MAQPVLALILFSTFHAHDRVYPEISRRRPNRAEVVQVAGAELGAQIIAAEAWYHLQNRLDKYQAAGEDPLGHLSEALAEGRLATANDKSRVLISRMNHPGRYRDRPGRPPGKHARPPDAERLAQRRRADRERCQDGLEPGGES